MAHQIENMFYVGETPWHKLGNQVSEDISISEGMVASGLNWNVGLEELVTVSGRKVQEKAVIRMTDNAVLGVVGPRYQPLQNCDAFNWFQPFLDAKECKLHTAGSLCDGKKIWVLTKLCRPNSEIVKNDEVAKFILLSNSHDGTTAIRVGYTPIRVVCANTLAAAHCSTASKLLRVRHTKNTMTNLEKIRDIMNNMDAEFEATAEQYRFLASREFNAQDVRKYVKVLCDVENVADVDLPTRTQNTIDKIMNKIFGEKQSMPGVAGTWWAAYNGFNEYLNYEYGRNDNNRIDSLWFGTSATDNKKALTLALTMAG